MLYSYRFFISWIVAAIVMYLAFYCWHGVFLNDLSRLAFPKVLFLSLAAVVYFAISFVLYRVFESKFLSIYFHNPLVKGAVVGFGFGFMLFAVVTVLGISFTKDYNFTYLAVDCVWQIVEQIIGGLIFGFGKIFIFEQAPELIHDRNN
jgi:uncharacterized membrane protein YedE/YeeE